MSRRADQPPNALEALDATLARLEAFERDPDPEGDKALDENDLEVAVAAAWATLSGKTAGSSTG